MQRNGAYTVLYTLTYNPATWIYEARIIYGGETPGSATVGDGIEKFNIYQDGDFSTLPFTLPAP